MGLLDNVFGGAGGVTNTLHNLLGGTATIRIATSTRDETTGRVDTTWDEYDVPFIPGTGAESKTPLSAPGASRSDVREPLSVLSGSIPTAALDAPPRAERDKIVYQGVEYLITTVDSVNIGDVSVQYSITAKRV